MIDVVMLGEKIKTLRKAKGLTQGEFAARLNVSFQAVSNWERGVTPPDIDNLVAIAEELGVMVDTLVRRTSGELMLAVDGGGTKTEFAVFGADGTVEKSFRLAATNPNDIGMNACADILAEGINACLIDHPGISRVYCGIAGVGAGQNKRTLAKRLAESFPRLEFEIDTDAASLLAADRTCPLALICGTGSVVYVAQGRRMIRVGGWGYLFDDGGSGYDIGRDGVRAALGELDGIGKKTLITEKLQEILGGDVWSSLAKLYSGGKPYIASLATAVFDAYAEGDAAARTIIENSMKRLALLINTAAARYGVTKRVMTAGGLIENNREILLPHLKSCSDAELVFSDLPPIYGACRACAEIFKVKLHDGFHEKFKATYEVQNA